MSDVRHLTRLRWGVRAVLTLGVAASVCANVLHAQPNPISQTIAAWPPVALLLTVELISRVPVHRRALAAVRLLATAAIAGIAAWVSYHHMVAVAARYGETGASAYLLPLSVDGLIVVGSVCLVELGGRLAATAVQATAAADPPPSNRAAAMPDDHPADQPPAAQPAHAVPAHAVTVPAAAAPALPSAIASAMGAVHLPASGEAAPVYQPTSDEDAAMYQLWRHGVAAGREPTGADLARAAGRPNDASGAGRRAARRYRDAHAHAAPPAGAGTPQPPEAAAETAVPPVAAAQARHNGHPPTLTGGAR